jgi:hypothetical protein
MRTKPFRLRADCELIEYGRAMLHREADADGGIIIEIEARWSVVRERLTVSLTLPPNAPTWGSNGSTLIDPQDDARDHINALRPVEWPLRWEVNEIRESGRRIFRRRNT